jgi:hypothetical protein
MLKYSKSTAQRENAYSFRFCEINNRIKIKNYLSNLYKQYGISINYVISSSENASRIVTSNLTMEKNLMKKTRKEKQYEKTI